MGKKQSTFFAAALFSLIGCASTHEGGRDSISSAHSPVGESFFGSDRAPASMSPPFEMGSEKVALDPTYMRTRADYHFTLAESYALNGDSQRAVEEYKLAAVYDPDSAVVRLKLAMEYVKKGQVFEGLEQGEQAIKMDPSYTDARLLLGGIYSALKLYPKAEDQYQTIIKNDPTNREVYLYLGALFTEQKKYKEAIGVFSKLAQDSEYESRHLPHYYMARVHLEKGDDKLAEASFNKALAAKPSFVEGALGLGTYYEKKKKQDAAVKLYESFQDKHGPNERIAEQLHRFYLEEEKYEKAYQQLEIVVAADPTNLAAKVKMALILIELKSYPKAIKGLKEILALAPDSDKIRFFLGAVYEEVKDYKSAMEQFQQIEPASSYFAEAVVHSTYLKKLTGDLEGAIVSIEQAIELRPETPQFYPLYASFLDDAQQYAKATKMLEGAVVRFPTSDQLHFFLGSMQDKLGDKTSTIQSMKKTLELNPDHVQAMNYLAYTYADMNQNLEEAYALAKKAYELKPDDAYIQDTVGWVYFKKGQYQEAVKILEAANKLKSDESIIAEHLGDAYYQLKLFGKAKEMYKRAVRLESNQENVRRIESKVSSIEKVDRPRSPASLGAD